MYSLPANLIGTHYIATLIRIAMYRLSAQTSAVLRTLKGTHPGAAFCIEKQCIGNVKA